MAKNNILAMVIISICHIFIHVEAYAPSGWYRATATFYGGSDASGTMAGACGFGNTYVTGYGVATTALSTALFNSAYSCGQCYRIVCDYTRDPHWCIKKVGVTVTAVDFCPPGSFDGWCDPPRPHFDMSQPSWLRIGIYAGGVVPVLYQRVPCKRHGGMRFTINGNPSFNLVLISNAAQAGSIKAISIKGSKTDWIPMSRNWGVNWQCSNYLVGQVLSFQITASNGAVATCYNIAPLYWGFGQTFSDRYCQFTY